MVQNDPTIARSKISLKVGAPKLGRFFFNFKTVPFVLPFRSSTVRFTNGFTVPFEVSTNRSDQFFLKMNGFCRKGTNFNGQER